MLTPKRRSVLKAYFQGEMTTAQAVRALDNMTRERFNTLKDTFAKEVLQEYWSGE